MTGNANQLKIQKQKQLSSKLRLYHLVKKLVRELTSVNKIW